MQQLHFPRKHKMTYFSIAQKHHTPSNCQLVSSSVLVIQSARVQIRYLTIPSLLA